MAGIEEEKRRKEGEEELFLYMPFFVSLSLQGVLNKWFTGLNIYSTCTL